MVLNPGAAAHPDNPQIKETRLAKADHDAEQVDEERYPERPETFEDEEQLGRDNRIGNEIAIGDPCKHLGPRKGYKYRL
jgi:hypothetical protein